MTRRQAVLASFLAAAALARVTIPFFGSKESPVVFGSAEVRTGEREMTLLSQGYRLDRIYRSMEGPSSPQPGLRVQSGPGSKTVWLTGLETDVIDANSGQTTSPEYLCHANLTFDSAGGDPSRHNQFFGGNTHLEWRLFTIVPGRFSIRFPEGFGIPIPSNAMLDYYTMSLNQNVRDREVQVRMRSRVHTVSDDEPGAPTKALFRKALYVLQPQSSKVSDIPSTVMKVPTHAGAGCADFCMVNASAVSTVGPSGTGQTLHWLVPPGKHTYRTEITPQFVLPFDTTVHYATFHIHPYGKSLRMRDLTTGEVVLNLTSRDWPDRLGVAHVDEIKSTAGIPIHASHRYEIEAEYDNTTDQEIDAMGILYLYLLEKNFVPPAAAKVAQATAN